jgi:hypothetical protein
MIWIEALAAVMVGIALTALVIGPLVTTAPPAPEVDDEPEELEQTPKGIALAALKEIEFDRATGKLSEEDYEFLKAKYTEQALVALRAEEPALASAGAGALEPGADVETLIAARARAIRSGVGVRACPTCGPRPEPDAFFCSECGVSLGDGKCGQCGADMEAGSRFCERCGSRVAA